MFNPKLDVAFWDYDRTRALVNGSVKIAGADASFHTAPIVTILFEGVVAGKFNVSELGMTYFLRTFKNGESPFVAIPIFPWLRTYIRKFANRCGWRITKFCGNRRFA